MLERKIIWILVWVALMHGVLAQSGQIIIQLVNYDESTQQSTIHIQNNADIELHEIDFFINNIKLGRVTNNLPIGKAINYFQTVTPGTYDVTIKTSEGIEATKEITFDTYKSADEKEATAVDKPKTGTQLGDDSEYLEFLEEMKKEEEIRRQRDQETQQKIKQQSKPIKVESKAEEVVRAPARSSEPNRALVITLAVIVIAVLYYLITRKKNA